MKKKWMIISIVSLILIIVIGINVWNKKADSSTKKVQITTLEEQEINETVIAPGKLKLSKEQHVYFQEEKGEVVEFLVEEGDKVEKGDELVRYKNDSLEIDRQQNELTLNADQLELENIQKQREELQKEYNENKDSEQIRSELEDKKFQEEQKKLDIQQTRLEQKSIEQEMADTIVTSDIDGSIVSINEDEEFGTEQMESKPLIQVGSLDHMRVEGEVSEYDALKISKGQPVKLTSDTAPDQSWKGEIELVSDLPEQSDDEQDDSGATYTIEAKVEDDEIDLKPGFEMLMEIETEKKETDVLPITAVEQDDNADFVYIVNNGKAERKEVQTDIATHEVIEITDGLSDKDEVIEDAEGIEEGMEVDAS